MSQTNGLEDKVGSEEGTPIRIDESTVIRVYDRHIRKCPVDGTKLVSGGVLTFDMGGEIGKYSELAYCPECGQDYERKTGFLKTLQLSAEHWLLRRAADSYVVK